MSIPFLDIGEFSSCTNCCRGIRSLAKLNDKNLRKGMDDARRTQEEKANDQLVAIRQVNMTIQEQSNSLQTHADTLTRLADGM